LQETIADLLDARYLNINGTMQKLLKSAEFESSSQVSNNLAEDSTKIFFKVIKARKLILKEGKPRDVYCSIEVGDVKTGDKSKKKEVYTTDAISVKSDEKKSTKGFKKLHDADLNGDGPEAVWNQHLNIPVRSSNEKLVLSVWDRRKNYFLGEVSLLLNEVKEWCEKEEYLNRWYPLQPRKGMKDKYIGGEILLEAILADEEVLTTAKLAAGPSPADEPEEYIRSLFVNCKVNLRELYKILLRSCLSLDMTTLSSSITESTEELLTLESRTILTVFGGPPKLSTHTESLPLESGVYWNVGGAFQVISYMELLFDLYQSYQVPTSALKAAYHTLRDCLKHGSAWLPENERPHLIETLSKMHTYYTSQVTNYKDFYPFRPSPATNDSRIISNTTSSNREALKTTLFMLRMINKEPIYRRIYTNIPESFRDELRKMMTEAAVVRFQRFQNLTSPLDETIVSDVVDGLMRLADFCMDDVKLDVEYYELAFHREISITQLVGETYLKYFIMTLQSQYDVFVAEEAVTQCADLVFALYHRVKKLDEGFRELKISTSKIDLEAWFVPFVRQWLYHLNNKTIEWVTNALKADNFEFINTPSQQIASFSSGIDPTVESNAHSSSVTDLFSVIYQELEFILDLHWQHPMQIASFLQAFARTTFNAIDQYCYTISVNDVSDEQAISNPAWNRLTSLAKLAQKQEPKDIQNQTCVKLCNMEYAIGKLEKLYDHMNVSSVTQSVRDYREKIKPAQQPSQPITAHRNKASLSVGESWRNANSITAQQIQNDVVKGAFGLQIAYAEDLKPCQKNGLSNPYLIVRVPDGTVVPPQSTESSSTDSIFRRNGADETPVVLTGKECEIIRTRAQYDTVNPQWDEKFQVMLPPVYKLEVIAYSRNLISADQLAGRAEIPLARSQYALKPLLEDHQTHDVVVELEPQGRVLLR
ncbi:hypothetical protein HK096_004316, partial [Nowakowskiella sp. JEL0078]